MSRPNAHARSQSGSWPETTARLLRGLVRWVLWPLLKWGLIVTLPFGALLRGSMYAYQQQWPLPPALLAGFAAAFLVLLLHMTRACGWANGTEAAHRFRTLRTKALLVLVVPCVFQG